MDNDDILEEFVKDLDLLVIKYQDVYPAHQIAGILLSRITLLMSTDTEVGKGLLKYVWEKLDEIEQNNPGRFI